MVDEEKEFHGASLDQIRARNAAAGTAFGHRLGLGEGGGSSIGVEEPQAGIVIVRRHVREDSSFAAAASGTLDHGVAEGNAPVRRVRHAEPWDGRIREPGWQSEVYQFPEDGRPIF